ncbi:MAG: histidine--tRNA ligase [Candidatus Jacksonbacteria bacterium]|nr:histidine--tRNA ligase [Candidatus Jacksonbacteria bacterium]MBT6756963.1 histidine--tRNA ligase [Candidatus Jacksonbacteria bacterium]
MSAQKKRASRTSSRAKPKARVKKKQAPKTARKKKAAPKRSVKKVAKKSVKKSLPLAKNRVTPKEPEFEPRKKSKKKNIASVRGMRDILMRDQRYWQWFLNVAKGITEQYGYSEIETPIVEDAQLFKRSIGDTTDLVQKEMYEFDDQSGDRIALRPEGTAGIVRAYVEHGMLNMPQPVKVYLAGPMFRYERPQSGRFRQFHQFNVEVLGSESPVMDAETILIAHTILKELGIETSIQVNSVGSPEARAEYNKVLKTYLKTHKSAAVKEALERYSKNLLRILDSKDPEIQSILEEAPQLIDYLDDDCRAHFVSVLEHLDELDLPYTLNPRIVRGLDYYNRTAFELWHGDTEETRQSALGGGGRYDGLVEKLGGRETPACGFALGIERIIAILRQEKTSPPKSDEPLVYLAQIGDNSKKRALKLFEQLRSQGIPIIGNLAKDGLRQQLEIANKKGAKFAVIVGQKEMIDGTVLIRDMESGIQETVVLENIEKELEKRLKKA